ncbi:hypothetical protein ACF0H5_004770 [Mactra antiquata]
MAEACSENANINKSCDQDTSFQQELVDQVSQGEENVNINKSSDQDTSFQNELVDQVSQGKEKLPLGDKALFHHATTDNKEDALKQLRQANTHDDDYYDFDDKLSNEASEKYVYFWKSESVYSQWHKSSFHVDGVKFSCAEQYMMYEKAKLFGDHEIAQLILKNNSPREIKKLGREVRDFVDEIWKYECLEIVKKGNIAKFSHSDKLWKEMIKTHPKTLVEASPYDSIWGIGLEEDEPAAWSQSTWQGTNYLGFILTEVRNDLMIEKGMLSEDQRLNFVKDKQKKYEKAYKSVAHTLLSSEVCESSKNDEKSRSKKKIPGTSQSKKDNENMHEDKNVSPKKSGKVLNSNSTEHEGARASIDNDEIDGNWNEVHTRSKISPKRENQGSTNSKSEEPTLTVNEPSGTQNKKKKKKNKKKKKDADQELAGPIIDAPDEFEIPEAWSSSSKTNEVTLGNQVKEENVKKRNKQTKADKKSSASNDMSNMGTCFNVDSQEKSQINSPATNAVKHGLENVDTPVGKMSRRQKRNAKKHACNENN